jgi:hypothetical protein
MSTRTDFEPEWNPTPINGELTAELGSPFRHIDTSLPVATSVDAMVAHIVAMEKEAHPLQTVTLDPAHIESAKLVTVTDVTQTSDETIQRLIEALPADPVAPESSESIQPVSVELEAPEDLLPVDEMRTAVDRMHAAQKALRAKENKADGKG